MNAMNALSATACMLLLGLGSAQAADTRNYAGLWIGSADHDLSREDFSEAERSARYSTFESNLETSSAAFGIFVGRQFKPWLALEAGFDHYGGASYDYEAILGSTSNRIFQTFQHEVEFDIKSLSASGVLSVPLGDRFTVGLRAGAAYYDAEIDVMNNFNTTGMLSRAHHEYSKAESGAVFIYGAVARFTATPNFSLRLEWRTVNDVVDSGVHTQNFDGNFVIPGFDISALSLAALAHF